MIDKAILEYLNKPEWKESEAAPITVASTVECTQSDSILSIHPSVLETQAVARGIQVFMGTYNDRYRGLDASYWWPLAIELFKTFDIRRREQEYDND